MFKRCLELVLASEGGFTSDTRDNGNRGGKSTNLGVTQAVWEEWLGHPVSQADMKALTPEKIAPMYEKKYWKAASCDKLPQGLNLLVFSMAINSGVGRAIKLLQKSLDCNEDGVIGSITLSKIKEFNLIDLVEKYSSCREDFYKSLKSFPIFGKGWLSRVEKERLEAIDLIKNA